MTTASDSDENLTRSQAPATRNRFYTICTLAGKASYLALTTLVVADLALSAFKAVQYFYSPAPIGGVSCLDSFSEPSVAVAILKQESEKLLMNYTQARDAASTPQAPATSELALRTHLNHLASNWSPLIDFSGFARGSRSEALRIQPMEKLHAAVQELDIELELKLLVIYWENSYERELVDLFLQLVFEAPENPEMMAWLPTALDSAQHCGRTDEIEDALRHTLWFHPHLKMAVELRKQEWERAHQAAHNTR